MSDISEGGTGIDRLVDCRRSGKQLLNTSRTGFEALVGVILLTENVIDVDETKIGEWANCRSRRARIQ